MRYISMTGKQILRLKPRDRQFISDQIADIMSAVGRPSHDIVFDKDDLTILCFDERTLAGFIHILPESFFYEGELGAKYSREMFVDFIAVSPQYQQRHIATDLYMRSIDVLRQHQAESLKAVLLNEYSRRAFEKTAAAHDLELTRNDSCCVETIVMK